MGLFEKQMKYPLSEELNMMLARPPRALLRWGIGASGILVLGLLVAGWVLPVSERLEGEITLVSDLPPVVVTTPSEGYIQLLMVDEGDTVRQGQLLAVMETTARLEDVAALRRWADSLRKHPDPQLLEEAELAAMLLQLGELQFEWDDFRARARQNSRPGSASTQVETIELQLDDARRRLRRLERELRALEEKKTNRAQAFRQAQKNYSEGLINLESLRKARANLWDIEEKISEKSADIQAVKSEIAQLELSKKSVFEDKRFARQDDRQKIAEAAAELLNDIVEWQRKHLVEAPAEGVISLYRNSELKRRLPAGKEIAAIIPWSIGSRVVGQLRVPPEGSARLQAGQQVRVELYPYPAASYGRLVGQVSGASLLPQRDGTYLVEVVFPHGLVTDKGIEIPFQPQLKGRAEIILDRSPLLVRMFR